MASVVRLDMDGMGLPLMDIFVRRFDKRGSTSFRMESAITAISGSKLERLGTGGRGCGKENLDVQDGGSEVLRKRNFQESGSGRSNHGGIKPTDIIKGDIDGSTRTHGAPCTGSGILQEVVERVGMEITGQDGSLESARRSTGSSLICPNEYFTMEL